MSWGIGDRVGVAVGLSNIASFLSKSIQSRGSTTYYGSFNGTTQSLSVANNAALQFGTGDFTVEFLVNQSDLTGYQVGYTLGFNSANDFLVLFTIGTGNINVQLSGSAVAVETGTTVAINTWNHIAVVRQSGVVKVYRNGNLVASGTGTQNIISSSAITIGVGPSIYYLKGKMSNLRVVKGTALYTANFTPPAAPLTAVSGTALLTLQDATIKDNSTNAFTITNTGSVATTSIPVTSLPPYTLYSASYLAVAGGASGGTGYAGGGGGAGGLLTGTQNLSIGTTYSFVVGAGGAAQTPPTTIGNNGSNSTALGLTAIGGGGGGKYTVIGNTGGSGGGNGGNNATTPAVGTSGQGNAGGKGANFTVGAGSGGGGGAGAVGGNSGTNDPGPSGSGGIGIASSITGTSTYYAGGGGGGAYFGTVPIDTPGAGGLGGGGAGGVTSGGNGFSGTVNTGGGGGGATGIAYSSGAGGSGIVIISVPTANYTGTVTGAPTVTTNGANTIMQFTSSGSYTA